MILCTWKVNFIAGFFSVKYERSWESGNSKLASIVPIYKKDMGEDSGN